MVDAKEVKSLLAWWRDIDTNGMDAADFLYPKIMDALGSDVDEILAFLDTLDTDDLYYISGIFEDIYGMRTTDEVWDALERLEAKIA